MSVGKNSIKRVQDKTAEEVVLPVAEAKEALAPKAEKKSPAKSAKKKSTAPKAERKPQQKRTEEKVKSTVMIGDALPYYLL